MKKKTYTVRALHWEGGWELHVEGVGVTQARSLTVADRQVRDYLETLLDIDASTVEVVIFGEIDTALRRDLDEAVAARKKAEAMQAAAATSMREIVSKFGERGFSGADTAVLLGVTKGRVSQLKHDRAAHG